MSALRPLVKNDNNDKVFAPIRPIRRRGQPKIHQEVVIKQSDAQPVTAAPEVVTTVKSLSNGRPVRRRQPKQPCVGECCRTSTTHPTLFDSSSTTNQDLDVTRDEYLTMDTISVITMTSLPNVTRSVIEQKVEYLQVWPYFVLFVMLENLILWLRDKPVYRLNDGITSLSIALLSELGRFIFRGAETYVYVYLFENYHLVDLDWSKQYTWYIALIGVDFCYYWMHRACHEVHILWAQHQVHHSSEDFNIAVGLRHSIMHGWCGFIFYLPLAMVIPPAQFLVHQQFNLIFQCWVHTRAIDNVGPFEFIFNTPNHHRVHHGSNYDYLDTNYGGIFIFWDRIFGTFAKELPGQEIVYGLVVNQPSFNLLHLHSFYTTHAFNKFCAMPNWKDKVKAILYGPSWLPGKPRLGAEEDIFKVSPRAAYDVTLPMWCNVYLVIHFGIVLYVFQEFCILHVKLNPLTVSAFILYIIGSLSIIGFLFDNAPYAATCELIRCALMIFAVKEVPFLVNNDNALFFLQIFFAGSGIFWLLHSLNVLQMSAKKKSE
ncbi:hypothetical protein RN001_005372 [Aquatica leii]|uniref:Alkylglycerol monooxygenase n=1 Tax=Aquatica leii TaxID=1421715 RepID=A0AAN7PCM5_9COLE|nr:hypothetical protein RN001_005372 [Aquatica leii]